MLEFRPRTDVGLSIDWISCWGTVFTFNIVKTNKNKWKYSMNIKSVKYLFVLCCVYVSETRVTAAAALCHVIVKRWATCEEYSN